MIARFVMFLLAVLFVSEALMPARRETVQVDRHVQTTHIRSRTDYRVYFSGSRAGSCDVRYGVYQALRDGDEVRLTTTRVFKSCDRIVRGDEVVQSHGDKLFYLVAAGFLFAGAFGWLDMGSRRRNRYDDDDDDPWWWSLLRALRP